MRPKKKGNHYRGSVGSPSLNIAIVKETYLSRLVERLGGSQIQYYVSGVHLNFPSKLALKSRL
jgi:hypothetical protein